MYELVFMGGNTSWLLARIWIDENLNQDGKYF